MRRNLLRSGLLMVALGLLTVQAALAYPVGPALPLNELFEQADVVCKVTAVASKEVEDRLVRQVAWLSAARDAAEGHCRLSRQGGGEGNHVPALRTEQEGFCPFV